LLDLARDLRLGTVLDKALEQALETFPGFAFAVLPATDDELAIARSSGLAREGRRQLELWARSTDAVLREPLETEARRSEPLWFRDESVGAVVTVAPPGQSYDDEQRELLAAFAEQVGIALGNARLFEQLVANASEDPLTGLANRREFERLLGRELERSSRYRGIFTIAILDLDEFKDLNDTHGHQAGDVVLRAAAEAMQRACRASDAACRLGGDEFALLLPATSQYQAVALCERLRAHVERIAGLSVTWGVAEFPAHGATAAELIRAADAAMYAAKPRLVGSERPLTGAAD
jgi:diguanylate cyclase (GGDEF)-like protein